MTPLLFMSVYYLFITGITAMTVIAMLLHVLKILSKFTDTFFHNVVNTH